MEKIIWIQKINHNTVPVNHDLPASTSWQEQQQEHQQEQQQKTIYSDVGNFLNSNNLFHDFGRWLFQKLTISSFPFFPTGFGAIFRFSSSFWYVYVRSRALEQFFEMFYFWVGGWQKSGFFKN